MSIKEKNEKRSILSDIPFKDVRGARRPDDCLRLLSVCSQLHHALNIGLTSYNSIYKAEQSI